MCWFLSSARERKYLDVFTWIWRIPLFAALGLWIMLTRRNQSMASPGIFNCTRCDSTSSRRSGHTSRNACLLSTDFCAFALAASASWAESDDASDMAWGRLGFERYANREARQIGARQLACNKRTFKFRSNSIEHVQSTDLLYGLCACRLVPSLG